MILMIDNYDSFTFNLVRYFEELEENVHVVKNDNITFAEIIELNPKAIILSPGPKRPEDSKICIEVVRRLSGRFPILGICLGHQVIGYVNELEVSSGLYPIHGVVTRVNKLCDDPIFEDIPNQYNVTRYHSLVVKDANDKVEILAKADDGAQMIIKEKSSLTYGIQYHPESFLTEYGHQILQNFLNLCKESND